jgi:hypothetical protein
LVYSEAKKHNALQRCRCKTRAQALVAHKRYQFDRSLAKLSVKLKQDTF